MKSHWIGQGKLIRIIIADSDREFRELVVFGLRFASYDAYPASSLEECYRMANDLQPQLILLESSLVREQDYSVLRALVAEGMTGRIPVMLLVRAGEEILHGLGFDWAEVIRKPISLDALTREVNLYFKKRSE